jgi:alcohol dehydrogenase (cytochrome c)
MNDLGELAAPTVYNGVMYVINGKWTFAIDLETGRQIWRTPVVLEPGARGAAINRGAPTIYNGKLFRVTMDNHLLALDMKTGKEVWKQKFADAKEGYYATAALLVANGVLISGMAGGESTTRGFLDGWEPDTGKKLWRRYTIPAPGEPAPRRGRRTTRGATAADRWRSGSYDPELDRCIGRRECRALDPARAVPSTSLYTSKCWLSVQDGRNRLLLPVHAQRRVRRGRDRRDGAGGPARRGAPPQSDDPGEQEWFPVRP